jgi:hypothetical protein
LELHVPLRQLFQFSSTGSVVRENDHERTFRCRVGDSTLTTVRPFV